MSIRLHREHGVNPTIPVCYFCGEDKNEVVLLGAGYKGEAPMRMLMDTHPCEQCQEYMEQGVILMGVDPDKSADEENPHRTGHFVVVKDDAIERVFDDEMAQAAIQRRAAFIGVDVLQALGAIQ
jgi:hypothetical protein